MTTLITPIFEATIRVLKVGRREFRKGGEATRLGGGQAPVESGAILCH